MGKIPVGMMVDHVCRRRDCVWIAHLDLVTQSENERRKSWRVRVRRTLCKYGHSLKTALVTPQGGRVCRECRDRQVTQ